MRRQYDSRSAAATIHERIVRLVAEGTAKDYAEGFRMVLRQADPSLKARYAQPWKF